MMKGGSGTTVFMLLVVCTGMWMTNAALATEKPPKSLLPPSKSLNGAGYIWTPLPILFTTAATGQTEPPPSTGYFNPRECPELTLDARDCITAYWARDHFNKEHCCSIFPTSESMSWG